jgi:HSP20 family protein
MFDKLIPWKRNHQSSDSLSVRHDDDPITVLRRDFDSLLSRLWDDSGLWRREGRNWLASPLEFDENEKAYVMTAELPGFNPSDIDVKVSGNLLTVRAEHKEESDGGNGRLRRYGSFYESFTLPAGVKADAIDARYQNGVLEVHVPKDDSAPAKRIKVKAA